MNFSKRAHSNIFKLSALIGIGLGLNFPLVACLALFKSSNPISRQGCTAFGNSMKFHNVKVKFCKYERFSSSIVVTFCSILLKNGQIGWPLCTSGLKEINQVLLKKTFFELTNLCDKVWATEKFVCKNVQWIVEFYDTDIKFKNY